MKCSQYFRFLMVVGLPGAVAHAPVAAREVGATAATAAPIDMNEEGGVRVADWHLPDQSRIVRTSRAMSIDWGSGGFHVQGERIKKGSKVGILTDEHQWQRSMSLDASMLQDLRTNMSIAGGLRLARVRSGSLGTQLLTRQTTSFSQEAYIRGTVGGTVGLIVSVFDRGGWSPGNLADSANRITNGETHASRGAAMEIGILTSPSNIVEGEQPRLSFRVERSSSLASLAESSGRLALSMRF